MSWHGPTKGWQPIVQHCFRSAGFVIRWANFATQKRWTLPVDIIAARTVLDLQTPCLAILEARRDTCLARSSQMSSSAMQLPRFVDRGYPVREVAQRLGISTKSIYTWQRLFSRPVKVIQEVDAQADEIRRLKRYLVRVTAERGILKRPWWVQSVRATSLMRGCCEKTHDGANWSPWLVIRAEG